MADVGRLAGVSTATVSFVLNPTSTQPISAATRARVLQAVADLEYRPNRAAQELRTRRSGALGIVVDESAFGVFAGQVVAGAHDAAAARGQVLLTAFSGRRADVFTAGISELINRQVDGLLIICSGTRALSAVPDSLPRSTVLVNCFLEERHGRTLHCVLPDDDGGGYSAARMLLDAGHRRITVLAGRAGAWATVKRLNGIQRAFDEAGLSAPDVDIGFGNYYLDTGYDLAVEVLSQPSPPTGLICGNDRMALGAFMGVAALGLKIPDDVSVVGYDDGDPAITQWRPALSTVRLPLYDMGRLAAEAVLDRTVDDLPDVLLLPCPPVPRGSVGPPRAH